MNAELNRESVERAARALPVFPLPGALLLPRGQLPLNIFEPRYLSMIEDALGEGRMIGMIQPLADEGHPVSDNAELFDIGCMGRITSFSETDDGRFLVTLSGIVRFRVGGEHEGRQGYRRITADLDDFWQDLQGTNAVVADRERLLVAVRAYFGLKGIETDFEAIAEAEDDPLITSLAMVCPFDVGDKQALLEAADVDERSRLLTGLMEMAVHEGQAPSTPARH